MSRWLVLALVACGPPPRANFDSGNGGGGGGNPDGSTTTGDGSTTTGDGGTTTGDGGTTTTDAGSVGVITGGPCMSGAAGATAYRIRWANGGGSAYPVYEVNGLP